MKSSGEETDLAQAVRAALSYRDALRPAPIAMTREPRAPSLSWARWTPAFAAMSAIAVVGLGFYFTLRPAHISDIALAEQLSSADYWRGPTDRLPGRADRSSFAVLPSLPTYAISLEESYL